MGVRKNINVSLFDPKSALLKKKYNRNDAADTTRSKRILMYRK
jgi:hypothetical protein